MPKKTGICLNVGGNCSLAKSKEIQTADVTHFKCSECGRDLISKTPPPPPPSPILLVLIGILLIGGAVGLYFWFGTTSGTTLEQIRLNRSSHKLTLGTNDTLIVESTPIGVSATYHWTSDNEAVAVVNNGIVSAIGKGQATIIVQANGYDSIKASCIYSVESIEDNEKKGDDNALPPAPSGGTDLGYAIWTGKVDANGLPDDTNGRMYFKERHRISPNDDLERYAEAGESIVGEYVNGKLIQGKWYKKDNNVESIILGN